jgi:hydrogenase/urease accessory protein HupE
LSLAGLWPAVLSLVVPLIAMAHDPGLSTATVLLGPDKIEAVLVFAGADAAQIVEIEKDAGGRYKKEAIEAAAKELGEMGRGALEVTSDGKALRATEARCRFDGSDNASVYVSFPAVSFTNLTIRSKWLAMLPPGHRQFLSIQTPDGTVLSERLLSANSDSVTIHSEQAGPGPLAGAGGKSGAASAGANRVTEKESASSFSDFLLMGVRHIWTGYDHLLFLFGLLIVTRNFGSSVKIITCFTIAHSITLAVATLSLVQVSSRIVEPLIAASIVYVGIENLLRGDDPKGRWLLTFGFGLIHGFGFASVLRELGVGANGSGIAVPLVSFNLGVEIGQIAIAGIALPVIWKLRTRPVFVRRWVPACSALVAVLGGYWFVQRVWF